jgi:hypothetical protein
MIWRAEAVNALAAQTERAEPPRMTYNDASRKVGFGRLLCLEATKLTRPFAAFLAAVRDGSF